MKENNWQQVTVASLTTPTELIEPMQILELKFKFKLVYIQHYKV